MEETTMPVEKKGISRRAVIAGGAVGAAAVWTVPLIASVPAGAAPPAGSTISSACSYFVLVYTFEGTTYADRVNSDGSCGGNTSSNDVSWCFPCGLDTYDNGGAQQAIRQTVGGVTTTLPSSSCTSSQMRFHVSGNTITPGTGVVILFAVAHAGNLDNTTGQDPGTPGTGGTCDTGTLVDKVNVACGPITSASFQCLAPSPV